MWGSSFAGQWGWFSREPGSLVAEPSCEQELARPVRFLYICVSQVCKPHTILPPVSAAKNKAETSQRLEAQSQPHRERATPRLRATSVLCIVLADWPWLCPHNPWRKGHLDKQTQEGEGSQFFKDGWLVSVYRKRVPEIRPCKFPPQPPHPGSSQPSSWCSQTEKVPACKQLHSGMGTVVCIVGSGCLDMKMQ